MQKAKSYSQLRRDRGLSRPPKDYRGSAASRGYDRRWRKARLLFLRANPLCVECEAEGMVVQATVVDHVIPHKGDQELFWDYKNWQGLCTQHHNKKTATQDGGFGNERR